MEEKGRNLYASQQDNEAKIARLKQLLEEREDQLKAVEGKITRYQSESQALMKGTQELEAGQRDLMSRLRQT
jgi:K+/H+ antiporter YhaU regulatory subunit KhtT